MLNCLLVPRRTGLTANRFVRRITKEKEKITLGKEISGFWKEPPMLDGKKEGHNPLAIANHFVEKAAMAGRPLSILHLVKLVYLAHGWCLGYTGKPLISSQIEGWRHGPVVREVYRAFRPQGIHNIALPATDADGETHKAPLSEKEQEIVDKVYNAYSPLSAFALSALTHARGTPWAQTEGYYAPIPNDIIREYYKKRVDESREATHHG